MEVRGRGTLHLFHPVHHLDHNYIIIIIIIVIIVIIIFIIVIILSIIIFFIIISVLTPKMGPHHSIYIKREGIANFQIR